MSFKPGLPTLPDIPEPKPHTPPEIPVSKPTPGVQPNFYRPSASSVNGAQDKTPKEITVSGLGALIPIVYGRAQVDGKLIALHGENNKLTLSILWALGELEEIERIDAAGMILVNPDDVGGFAGQLRVEGDNNIFTIAFYNNHVGGITQGIDAILGSDIAGYSDTNVITVRGGGTTGLAYTSFRLVNPARWPGFPRFKATVKGVKIFDPRSSLFEYSDNPALCLADFISSDVRGLGAAIDWNSVEDAANFCDEIIGGEKRRLLGLAIAKEQTANSIIELLRTYAGCFVYRRGAEYVLVPDKAGTVSIALTSSDIIQGSMKLSKKSKKETPTVAQVTWTDTTIKPWAGRETEPVFSPGVIAGTTPWRQTKLQLPGIQRYSQAKREAIERLNYFQLLDLTAEFQTFDKGILIEPGDIISVTHPIGLTNKKFRVGGTRGVGPGRWHISAFEYDSAVYSDAVESEPTTPDITLENPGLPPTVNNVAINEEVYKLVGGGYASRLIISWDAVDFSYLAGYAVAWMGPGGTGYNFVNDGNSRATIEPVEGGKNYWIAVQSVSTTGAKSESTLDIITPLGKLLPPGDVPNIDGVEIDGEIRLSWDEAIDIDIVGYQIKTGPVGGAWETLKVAATVDALEVNLNGYRVGTTQFAIKALDSVGNYSANAASVNITVTETAESNKTWLHVPSSIFTTAGMISYTIPGDIGAVRYVSLGAAPLSFNASFPSTLDSYASPVFYYGADDSQKFIEFNGHTSESEAFSGKWSITGGEKNFIRIRGDADTIITPHHVGDITRTRGFPNVDYSYAGNGANIWGTVLRIQTPGDLDDDVFMVRVPGVGYRADQKLREDSGTATTTTSQGAPVTVYTNLPFAEVKSISVIPNFAGGNYSLSAFGLSYSYNDGVSDVEQQLAAFNVYAVENPTTADSNGPNYVAVSFRWQVTGY